VDRTDGIDAAFTVGRVSTGQAGGAALRALLDVLDVPGRGILRALPRRGVPAVDAPRVGLGVLRLADAGLPDWRSISCASRLSVSVAAGWACVSPTACASCALVRCYTPAMATVVIANTITAMATMVLSTFMVVLPWARCPLTCQSAARPCFLRRSAIEGIANLRSLACSWALEEDLLLVNPAMRVKNSPALRPETRPVWSMEEIARTVIHARGLQVDAAGVLAGFSGLRVGEIGGLLGSDLALERSFVNVCRTVEEDEDGTLLEYPRKTARPEWCPCPPRSATDCASC
jgi:hypothetical protein